MHIGKKIDISYELLSKIYNLSIKKRSLNQEIGKILKDKKDSYSIDFRLMIDMIEFISKDCFHILKLYNDVPTTNEEQNKRLELLISKFNLKKTFEDSDYEIIMRTLLEEKEEPLLFIQNISLLLDIIETDIIDNKLLDLKRYRDALEDNLEYLYDIETRNNILKQYNELLDQKDFESLYKLINKIQKDIRDKWHTDLTDMINFKQGQPFKFIGHSTSSTKFEGEFRSNYVSATLHTEDLTDTYRSGYGFILEPINIVAAGSSDLYVDNNALDTESLRWYTSVPQLDLPEVIIKEETNLKKQSEDSKVYSEIVLKGFHPIAIFCFTDGSLDLNHNYERAKKLQESFPNLKVIEIDLTYYKLSTKKKNDMQKDLVNNIRFKLNGSSEPLSDKVYLRYEYLWNQFLKLKEKGNYSVNDIIEIYQENLNMIVSGSYDFNKLLNNPNVPKEKIYNYLYYSLHTNIFNILNNDIDSLSINRFNSFMEEYQNNKIIEDLFPGINQFYKLIQNEVISDQLKEVLKGCNTFKQLNIKLIDNIALDIKDNNIDIKKYKNLDTIYERLKYLIDINKLNYDIPGLEEFMMLYPKLSKIINIDINDIDELNFININKVMIEQVSLIRSQESKKYQELEEKRQLYIVERDSEIKKQDRYYKAEDMKKHKLEYIKYQLEINKLLEELNELDLNQAYHHSEIDKLNSQSAIIDNDISKLSEHRIINFVKITELQKEKTKKDIISNQHKQSLVEVKTKIEEFIKKINVLKLEFQNLTGYNYDYYDNHIEAEEKYYFETNIYTIENNIEEYNNNILELNIQIDLIHEKLSSIEDIKMK